MSAVACRSAEQTSRERRLVLVATSLGFAVVQLDVSVVNVAMKPIGVALGGGISSLQWVVNAYTLPFAALILTFGALGDRIGAKRVFACGFVLFGVASACCGLAPSLLALIGARAVQGVGAAALVPCSLTLLSHTFPEPRERIRALGIWAAGASAALSAGPLLGGILTSTLGWRAIFFINVPIAAAGIALTVRYASETTRTARSFDVWGQVTSILGLTALVGATIAGGQRGFTAPAVLAAYAAAIALLALFALLERRGRHPMLPREVLRGKARAALPIGFTVNIAFYGIIFALSLFFQEAQRLSVLDAGLEFAPMTVAIMCANLLTKRLTGRLGERGTIAAGAALMAATATALIGVGASASYLLLLAPLVGMGFGLGLIVPAMTSAMLGAVEQKRSGLASGALNSARQTGSVIGVAVYGSLIAGHGVVSGLHLCLAISAGLALVVCALSRAVRERS